MSGIVIALFILQTLLAIGRPTLAATTILALLPSYLVRSEIGGIPTTILEALLLGTIIGWALRIIREGQAMKKLRGLALHPLFVPTALFLFAGTVAAVVSPERLDALGIWKAYIVEPALFGLVIANVMRERRDRALALAGLAVSAAAVIATAFLQRFAGFPIPAPWQTELRVTGPYEYPNAVGLLLAPIATLLITVGLGIRDWGLGRRIALILVGILGIAATVLSKTEAGLVGILAGLFVFGMFWTKKTRIITLIASLVAAAIIVSPGVWPSVREKILLQDWSGTVRRVMWTETAAMLRDRPLSGAGLSGYPTVIAPYHKDPKVEIFQYPHNIVLNFWSETGLLGLLAFGWIVFEFFRLARRRGDASLEIPLAAAMTAILIHGLVDVPYFKNDLSILFWAIVGLMAAATLPKDRKA